MVNAVKVFTLRLCISAYYIHFKRVKVKIFTAFTIPTDAELFALFKGVPTKICRHCGKLFASTGRKVYCSEQCAEEAHRQRAAERVRKHRANKAEM